MPDELVPRLRTPAVLAWLAAVMLRRRAAGAGRHRGCASAAPGCGLAAFAALAAALFNPVLLDEEREPLKSVVALIVDRSQSQDIGARTEADRRALAGLQERLARFKQFDVRVVEAGQAGAADDRTETRLFGALDSAFRDVPPSRIGGAVMITDGQVHDVPETAAAYRRAAARADHRRGRTKWTGASASRMRRVSALSASRIDMTYRVIATGGERGAVDVRVSINGQQVNVERAEIGREMQLQLIDPQCRPQHRRTRHRPASTGELTDTNNRAIALIDGIRENLRVLLVSGEPHAGERTWRNLLKSDASVDLVHFTILRPPEKQDGTPINELSLIAFPTRELFVEKINDFDLIIFDRYQHRDVLPILYYDYIAEYVEKGGALLIAAGPEYAGEHSIARTPLMAALPAMPTGDITGAGLLSAPYRNRQTPPGYTRAGRLGLRAAALEPLVPPDRHRAPGGRGRHEGAGRPAAAAAQPQGRRPRRHAPVRPGLAMGARLRGRRPARRALPPHRPLADEGAGARGGAPDGRRPRHGAGHSPPDDERRSRARAGDHAVGQDASTVPLTSAEPGLFTGSAETTEIGLYQIGNGDLSALAHIGPVNAPEFAETVSTETVLRPTAEATGGSVRRLAGADRPVACPQIVPVRGSGRRGRPRLDRPAHDRRQRAEIGIARAAVRRLFRPALLLLALGSMWYREGR